MDSEQNDPLYPSWSWPFTIWPKPSKKITVNAAVLDFSKTFDKVPHKRLIYKLHYSGIRGPLLSWIESFVTNRSQSVVCEGKRSNPAQVTSVVPQGTVLGPLLFLLYVNDLPDNLKSSIRLFADDALLYGIVSSVENGDQLQEDLRKLEVWQSKWQMSFNPAKCKTISPPVCLLWSRVGTSWLYFLSKSNPERQLEVVKSRLIYLWQSKQGSGHD